MYYGKKVCASLKQVRKQIADANDIPYEVTECKHQGNCKGTCPKCEAELRYIENQLSLRRAAGLAVSIVGLSLGVATTFASCSAQQPTQPSEPVQPVSPSMLEETEGEIILDGDVCAPVSEPEPAQSHKPSDQRKIEVPEFMVCGEDDTTNVEEIEILSVEEYGPSEGEAGDPNTIFTVVEEEPEYPGGSVALMEFIRTNLRWPFNPEECISGRVTLSFVIEKDGSITDIRELRSPDSRATEEAIRVVKLMPKWKPGKMRGQNVRVVYMLPITFRLE